MLSGPGSGRAIARGGSTGSRTQRNGLPDLHHAPAARGRRAFRASDAALEPAHGALHLWHPQRRAHPRPDTDRADDASGAAGAPRRRRQRRPGALRRHQAAGPGAGRPGGQALRPVLRQPSLARRHADQLEDDQPVDPAPARSRGPGGRGPVGPDQEGAAPAQPRAREARAGPGRHQGHGRPARHAVHHRHQQGGDRGSGGDKARHPGRRHLRQQQRSVRRRATRCRATTTRAAPSTSIATSSWARFSTAFRPRWWRAASISAPWTCPIEEMAGDEELRRRGGSRGEPSRWPSSPRRPSQRRPRSERRSPSLRPPDHQPPAALGRPAGDTFL